MARILILRDAQAAVRTARLLEARGDEALVLPLQAIVPLAPEPPAGPFGGLVVTSANAVPYIAAHLPVPHPPILAVGEASAAALRRAGFEPSAVGPGSGIGLAEEAERLHRTAALPLLYLAGRVRTEGLEQALAHRGVAFRTLEVYDTVPIDPERGNVESAVGSAGADAVLLLSTGQAEVYRQLAARFPQAFSPPPTPLCLSQRIAEALPPPLRQEAVIAARPELSELLRLYRRGATD